MAVRRGKSIKKRSVPLKQDFIIIIEIYYLKTLKIIKKHTNKLKIFWGSCRSSPTPPGHFVRTLPQALASLAACLVESSFFSHGGPRRASTSVGGPGTAGLERYLSAFSRHDTKIKQGRRARIAVKCLWWDVIDCKFVH